MNMKESLDLFLEIDFKCSLDKSKEGIHVGLEKISLEDEYSLLINSVIVSDSSLDCIKEIVKKCDLKMGKKDMNSQKYIQIYK